MTTYQTDVVVTTDVPKTARNLGIDTTQGGKLSSTRATNTQSNTRGSNARSSSGGSNSSYRQPNSATQAKRIDGSGNYGNPMRNHVDVKSTEVPGSKRQTLGNRARVAGNNARNSAGKLAKTVGSVGSRLAGRVTPGIGINPKGDLDFGLRAGGAGISLSTKLDLTLGIPGLSVTTSLRNPGNTQVDFGFGSLTCEQTRDGCSITVTWRLGGKIINQDTRKADNCREPEPEPTPQPTPEPPPKPNNPSDVPPATSKTTTTVTKITNPSGMRIGAFTRFSFSPEPTAYTQFYDGSAVDPVTGYPKQPIPVTDKWDDQYFLYDETKYGDFYIVERSFFYTYSVILKDDATQEYIYLFGTVETTRTVLTYNEDLTDYYSIFYDFLGIRKHTIYKYGIATNNIITLHTRTSDIYFYPLVIEIKASNDLNDLNEIPWLFHGIREHTVSLRFIPLENGITNTSPTYEHKPRGLLPMAEDCCDITKRIYVMLGGDQFFNQGLTIPTQMFTPAGSGMFRMKNYHEIFNIIFRTFSHRTPGEIEFTIEDTNKGKQGNQSISIKTINAQGYYTMLLKSISNLGYENTDQMNVLVRLGVVSSQIMKLLVIINQNAKNLLNFFDVPTKDFIENVDIPFDLSLGGSLQKGFKSREDLQKELLKIVDQDTEEAIEGILDRFLNEWQMPTKVQKLRSTKEGGNFWYFLKQLKG